MEKSRAIPKGFMTVGEIAKKMGITVRTLQHYDKEGFFSPSAESEGGRRLYTDKDLIRLHQILSLKHLGFSLEDIKSRIMPLDTPAEVAAILTEQAADMQRKITQLTQACEEIERLKTEVLQMQSVNFKKYADIIVNLQMNNEFYWLIKHFDDQTLDYVRSRFDMESGTAFMNQFKLLNSKIAALQKKNLPPGSEAAQLLAKDFWQMVMEFTSGDMSMLPKLMEFSTIDDQESESTQSYSLITDYMEKALDVYFTKLGVNPFEEGSI